MPELNADLKAELLAIGSVDVDESVLAGTSTSSAGPGPGPGPGLKSLFFKSDAHRVRLDINRNSQLKMTIENNDFITLKGNK